MKAGLDCGSTLVKAVWMKNDDYRFSSTAETPLEEIVHQLKSDGVHNIHIAGIGYSKTADYFRDFDLHQATGDPIEHEIRLQAEGTRYLLQSSPCKEFLLVSVGTGTSYTLVTDTGVTRFPIGNSLGGGFINGLGKVLGAKDYSELAAVSAHGIPLDLCIKDMIPEKAGSFEGELVIANFGKGNANADKASAYATVISTVAIAIIRDILVLGTIPTFRSLRDVVYIGSSISRTPLLRNLLETYSQIIGRNPLFPEKGEFALAMGAYHQPA